MGERDTPTILVVDDEESIRTVIARQLEILHYRIKTAGNADEALISMGEDSFDVLITDHMMTGKTGLELIVETNRLYPDIIKILLTGFGDRTLYREAINKGAVFSVIEKPCDARTMMSTVTRAIEHRYRRLTEREEYTRLRDQYHAIFANTTDIILCIDTTGRFIYVNPAWHTVLGYASQDIRDMTIGDIVHTGSMNGFLGVFDAARNGETVPPFESRLVRHDGGDVYIEGSVAGSTRERDVATVTFILRDVTDRKRATEELTIRLREQTMIARIADMFARTDEPASVFGEVLRIIGETADADGAFLLSYQDSEECFRNISRWQKPGRTDAPGVESINRNEIPWITDTIMGGATVCMHTAALPERDRDTMNSWGTTSFLVLPVYLGRRWAGLLGMDVTRTDKMWDEQEINMFRAAGDIVATAWTRQNELDVRRQKEQEAGQSRLLVIRADRLAALGTMTAGIIHEITQPLNAINVSTQTFLYGISRGWTLESEQVQSSLQLIVEQIKRMTDIITNMRAFARDGLPSSRTDANLNDIVKRVFTMGDEQLKAHNIEVIRNFGDIPDITMNTQQIFQIILNLVTNARQALDEYDAGIKRLILTTHATPDMVVLEVADSGPGVPEDLRDKIFDPFFTTKEVGKGTGLGLSISAGIVNDHNGELIVHNNEMGGTSFEIHLPRVTTTAKEGS